MQTRKEILDAIKAAKAAKTAAFHTKNQAHKVKLDAIVAHKAATTEVGRLQELLTKFDAGQR